MKYSNFEMKQSNYYYNKSSFTQGSGLLMSSQTMAQVRRQNLKRALTEVTSDTVSYVKTVVRFRTTHNAK